MESATNLQIKTKILALAFIGLNILDAAFTAVAVQHGMPYELNSIMRQLLKHQWMFWTFKIGLALIFALVLAILSGKFPRQIHRILLILVVAMVDICIINTASLVYV